MKKKILITGIGGEIGQGISLLIKKYFPSFEISGTDYHKRHSGKLFVKKFYLLPKVTEKKYLKKISNILKKKRIDIVIPTSENEIQYFNRIRNKIDCQKFILPSPELINVGSQKMKTSNFLKYNNIMRPWTYEIKDFNKIKKFPCIVKPNIGRGSKNNYICKNIFEAKFYSKTKKNFIFQELLKPSSKEITCAIYRFKDRRIKVIQLLRQLKGGYTSWAKVLKNKKIDKMCKTIAEKINFFGPANFQMIYTKTGPKIFEINARFSSTVYLRDALGFTDLMWSVKEKLKIKIKTFKPIINKEIARFDKVKIIN